MSDFLNSFRPTAQMVSSTLKYKMRPIVEHTGKAHQISSWKVEPTTLKFLLKGNMTYDRILPYAKEIVEPQRELLMYILRQLSSKELVNRYCTAIFRFLVYNQQLDFTNLLITCIPFLIKRYLFFSVMGVQKPRKDPVTGLR